MVQDFQCGVCPAFLSDQRTWLCLLSQREGLHELIYVILNRILERKAWLGIFSDSLAWWGEEWVFELGILGCMNAGPLMKLLREGRSLSC